MRCSPSSAVSTALPSKTASSAPTRLSRPKGRTERVHLLLPSPEPHPPPPTAPEPNSARTGRNGPTAGISRVAHLPPNWLKLSNRLVARAAGAQPPFSLHTCERQSLDTIHKSFSFLNLDVAPG